MLKIQLVLLMATASTLCLAQGNPGARLQVFPDRVELGTNSGLTGSIGVRRVGLPAAYAWSYTATVATNSGGNWLSVAPPTGSIPATLTVTATPGALAPGEYTGTVTIKSSEANVASERVEVTFRVGNSNTGPSNALVRPGALQFNGVEGGAKPENQTLTIANPNGGAGAFTWTASRSVSSPTGGTWLQISPASGNGPGTITVSVNTTGLTQGRYEGKVTVLTGSSTSSEVNVGLMIRPSESSPTAGGRLVIDPRAFNFIVTPGSTEAPPNQELRVRNAGNGTLTWTATAASESGNWLSISPTSGTAPSTINIAVNKSGLATGMYEGSITVKSGDMTETARVTLRVLGSSSGNQGDNNGSPNATGAVQFTPRVVEFRAPSAGAPTTPAAVPVQITSKVTGLTFTATTTTTRGGNWLAITPPASGSVPGSLSVFALTNGLADGVYHGMIQVNIAGSTPEQRVIPVVLRIGAQTDADDVDDDENANGPSAGRLGLSRGAVVLRTTGGGTAPEPASVSILSRGGGMNAPENVNFQATVATTAGGSWLSVSPTSGKTPAEVSIKALNTATLAPGAYRGTVLFQPESGSSLRPATLQVLLIVAASGPSASDAMTSVLPANFGGAPNTGPSGVFLNPPLDFQSTVDRPEAVQVQVFSAGGQPLEGAKVQLTGLGGNSLSVLEDAGDGLYTGFFQAANHGAVTLTAKVSTSTGDEVLVLTVNGSTTGGTNSSGKSNPVVLQGGLSAAPGATISLYGRSLASEDVHVFVGMVEATVTLIKGVPGDGIDQLDVQLPSAAMLNGAVFADLVVVRDGMVSAPQGVVLKK